MSSSQGSFHAFKKRRFEDSTVDTSLLQAHVPKSFFASKPSKTGVEVKNADPFGDYVCKFSLDGRKVCLGKERKDLVYLDQISQQTDLVTLSKFQSSSFSNIIRIYRHQEGIWMVSEYLPVKLPKILCWQPVLTKKAWELIIYSLVQGCLDLHSELHLSIGDIGPESICVAECGSVKIDIYNTVRKGVKFDTGSTPKTDGTKIGQILTSIVQDHKPASVDAQDRIPSDLRGFVSDCSAGKYKVEEMKKDEVVVAREPCDALGCLAHMALYRADWEIE